MDFKASLKTSLWLCALFIVVYGASNQLSAMRPGVHSLFAESERRIPFIPLFIIPYMSIDLFFAAAPFFCTSPAQRRQLAARISAAILIAAACWLAFPLRFAFERPHATGALGAVFDAFLKMDQPFNQLPSLHVALAALLAPVYMQRTRGLLRWAVCAWFILIILSTVFTYQHHVVDIAGGLALAVVCFHFFGQSTPRRVASANRRIGCYYASGAALLAGLAWAWTPFTLLLLWPASSLALISSAYFAFLPAGYQKRDGRLTFTTWLLFWPLLLGQRLSLRHYARRSKAWDALTDRIWIGRRLSDREARQAIAQGVSGVIDLAGEFSESRAFLPIPRLHLPLLDLTAPPPGAIRAALDFLRSRSGAGITYIHCKAGYSRTAVVAAAWLVESGAADGAAHAVALLRAARPAIIIRPEALRAIEDFANSRGGRAAPPTPLPAAASI